MDTLCDIGVCRDINLTLPGLASRTVAKGEADYFLRDLCRPPVVANRVREHTRGSLACIPVGAGPSGIFGIGQTPIVESWRVVFKYVSHNRETRMGAQSAAGYRGKCH